ncbi:hypothetical protein vseg_007307 [Gypsophila vaccaria]
MRPFIIFISCVLLHLLFCRAFGNDNKLVEERYMPTSIDKLIPQDMEKLGDKLSIRKNEEDHIPSLKDKSSYSLTNPENDDDPISMIEIDYAHVKAHPPHHDG